MTPDNVILFNVPYTEVQLSVAYTYQRPPKMPYDDLQPPDWPELTITSIKLYGYLNSQLLDFVAVHAPGLFEAIEFHISELEANKD